MIPAGSSSMFVVLGDTEFQVFTYRPAGRIGGFIFVFHGNSRNAGDYRSYAVDIAERRGLIVLAPLFDEARFPSSSYHRGNIVDATNRVRPRSQWTTRFVPLLVEWARHREGADLPYWLWGYSAGGQFLSRVAAFEQPAARRIVIGSPSTYVLPLVGAQPDGERAPYGMGGVFDPSEEQEKVRGYLALPLTFYLGGADSATDDPLLSQNQAAMRQGEHRLNRGLKTFALGNSVAERNGWACAWRIVIGPEIPHTGSAMLRSRRILPALGLFDLAPVYRIGERAGEIAVRLRLRGSDGRPGQPAGPRVVRAA